MRKESVQKFDLEAAFKALDAVEIPVVKGIRPNRESLQEKFTRKLVTDSLVEDYYDVGDSEELGQAQEEREAEVAKAKLARIEKIVDLDAETEEDILPSYVGKFIMQCPQCMTLFYKNEEDIERSEESPEVVNLNEPCQHCGNSSGYTLVGKVDTVGEEEASQYDVEDFEENELDLNFDEEEATEEESTEADEEVATEEETGEDADLDLDLAPVEDEEEEVQESLKLNEEVEESLNEDISLNLDPSIAARFTKDQLKSLTPEEIEILKNPRDRDGINKVIAKYTSKDEALNEGIDKELDDKLKAHNDYIEYLKKMIEDEETNLAKATNEYVKKAIQRRLDAFKADLEEALPAALKDEAISADELPTPEEADMKAAAENKDEPKEKKESLTEDLETEQKLDAEEADLENSNAEDYIVEATQTSVAKALDALEAELTESLPREPQVYDMRGNLIRPKDPEILTIWGKVIDQAEADGITFWNDYATQKKIIDKALTPEEIEKLKHVEFEDGITRMAYESLNEATSDVSDADFRAMLKNPIFNEGCADEKLKEDIPPADAAAFDKAADAIEAAGSELTPEEQKLEDEELAAKDGVEESLTESADLLADDGTLAALIYPNSLSPEARKEKLLADPAFVKALEVFTQQYNMVAKSDELEDGVSLIDDMYDCTFEGIEGGDLEDTLDELISYYLDIKGEDELTEAAPQGEFVSKLKRNYSATELMVKELKGHPLFSGLSTRTIQRVLLPYYIENMGRSNLSADAMIDFFTEEGFAPYVLDHFLTVDPLIRKELLKADDRFMKIFNAFAKKYRLFPTDASQREPGEDDFDYAFRFAFDFNDKTGSYDNKSTHDTISAFGRWYAAGKFDEKLTDDIWNSVEEFDETEFNKLTEQYLTTVYSNVKSFETTGCNLEDNKLVVEGTITFNSGKSKSTTFIYEACSATANTVILEGLNADFATEKAFTLNCKVDLENRLIVESLNYKYSINNTLVEGLLK